VTEVDGKERYRYMPVSSFDQDQTGKISFEEGSARDPFDYLNDPDFYPSGNKQTFLASDHNEAEWLSATYKTKYPDAVVAIVKSLRWNSRFKDAALSRTPDLVLSAAPGWNFRKEDIEGADHGSLRAESMRMTFMMSGTRLKQGVIEEPHRMIELTPTLFELIGYDKPTDFDEASMKDIYENKI